MARKKRVSKAVTKLEKKQTSKRKSKSLKAPVGKSKNNTGKKKVASTLNKSEPKKLSKPASQKKKSPKVKFKPGDHVVYPTHGVGTVQGIERETIDGHDLHLVVVTFDNERMTLRIPTNKLEESGLREISSQIVIDDAITTLRGKARVKRTMWSRRAQEYEAKINSGDPVFIAEVLRDLHRNVGQPDQSFSERQIYEAARDRLAAELAAIEKTDVDAATEKLEKVLEAA